MHFSDKNNDDAKSNLEILGAKLKDGDHDGDVPNVEEEDYYMQHKYEALCRGEYITKRAQETTSSSRYRCSYVTSDPLLILQPVKYEIISRDPDIYQYYEVVSKLESRILKRLAFPYVSIDSLQSLIYLIHHCTFSAENWVY